MSLITKDAVSSEIDYGVIDYNSLSGKTIGRELFVAAMLSMQRGTIGHKILISFWIALTLLLVGATSWLAVDSAQAQAVDVDLDQLGEELENVEHNSISWFLVDSRFTSATERCGSEFDCNDIVVVEAVVSNPNASPRVIDIEDVTLNADSGSSIAASFFDCGSNARQFVSESQQVVLNCVDRTARIQLDANVSVPVAMLFELEGQAEYGSDSSLQIRESHRRTAEASVIELG